jgi:hypothetical protein
MYESSDQALNKLDVKVRLDLNNGSTGPQILARVQRLTTATKTLTVQDSGTYLFCAFAGATTVTLPTTLLNGWHAWIIQSVDQTLTVTGAANTVVTFNDLLATSVAYSTGGNAIGQGIFVICDGVSYHALDMTKGTFTVT